MERKLLYALTVALFVFSGVIVWNLVAIGGAGWLRISDAVIVLATIAGPTLAIQLEKYLERRREERNHRMNIFKTLMATRQRRLSAGHVEALNVIDLHFSGGSGSDKRVRYAWKAYFDHLGEPTPEDTAQRQVYFARRDDMFTDLLFEMSVALDFDFDKTFLRKQCYQPIWHGELEQDELLVRKGLVGLFTGQKALPIKVVSDGTPEQVDLARLMAENIRSGVPFPVVLVEAGSGRNGGASGTLEILDGAGSR